MDKYLSVNAEGCSIRARLYLPDRGEVRQAVLFGHGFGGHKDNRAAERFARRILEKNKGVAIVTFDWPCHGDDAHGSLRLADCGQYLRLTASPRGEAKRAVADTRQPWETHPVGKPRREASPDASAEYTPGR